MKKKSFFKDLIRSIYKSKARFLSILAIIALGVGFYAGINATEPDMILSANTYYKETNLSDFRIISPLGFKGEDIENVEEIEGVDTIQAGYSKDLFLTSQGGDTSTVKIFSYNPRDYGEKEGANTPVLMEGRMPERSGEIVLEHGLNVPSDIKIGSEVSVSLPKEEEPKDFMKKDTYIVVGKVNSPLYIDFERGQTNIGDGSIGFFAYILEDDFTMERATDLFIRTKDSKNLTAYSSEYKSHITPIEDALASLGMKAMAEETQEMKDELREGKEELEANKEKAEKELADGEQKLQNAQEEILEGERELTANEKKFTKELEDSKKELEEGREELEKGKALHQENYDKWQAGYREYEEGAKELDQAKAQLDDAKIQIKQGEETLTATRTQLEEGKAQLDKVPQSIKGLEGIQQGLSTQPPASPEEFTTLIEEIAVFSPETAIYIIEKENMNYGEENLALEIIGTIENTLANMEEAYEKGEKEYQARVALYEEGMKTLEEKRAEYEAGLAEYERGRQEIAVAKMELDQAKNQLDQAKATIDENERQIRAGQAALTKGQEDLKRSLEEGRRTIANAREELAEGRLTFEEEKVDALQKIKEAEETIRDAERQLLEIPEEWFVLTREGNPGYSGYGDDAQRIGAVAKVFPLFFFLVAALVCLTTMTRMIEEERIQIGTLKALGYDTLTISSKYLIYALLSSLSGALLGLTIGFRLFPIAIMDAYGMMYNIPERLTPFHWNYAGISIMLALVTTVSAALLATLQELRATPAILMQPKAPKPGKRIFLERITPLWKRLSFSHKVTARNIFRYKRRFLMTVIGIAGCTALLVTGFGLRDSINDIMGKQFEEIFIYDGQVALDIEKSEEERDLGRIVGGQGEVESYMQALNQSVDAVDTASGRSYEVNLLVGEGENFEKFFDLHERTSQDKIELTATGAVITEKLSNLLHVGVGETFHYRDAENISYEIKVEAIAENYLSHYIYLSPEYFETISLETPVYNSGIFNVRNMEDMDEKAFKEELISQEGVLGVVLSGGIANEFNDTMESLDYVVLILILSAGALAFVVLYNLTNINITERIREIATIKVLGFRDKEVSSYVYRENMILTIIGTFVGLVLGFVLHRFVMNTMEIDAMMFGRNIHLISYLLSIILTVSFSILVNFFMYYKLRNVNMVESLKSVE